ncbi:MAG: glycosyltransferase family 4 protein [Planctomycetes bacterium]|nr:glycosyltransferase family 4 protein [Planctomycetota bacterium]
MSREPSAESPSELRPLLIAEAANPEWVSVPLVGWSHAHALLKKTRGHLVTQIRNRDAILRAGLVEGRDFTAIDSERSARLADRVARLLRGKSGVAWTMVTALQSLAYPHFERLVWKQFGARLRAGEFDLVHRITPLSPTTPSSLAKRCARIRVPFVLGPLNGGLPWPRAFDRERRREREWLSYIRGAYKLMPGYRATRAHAAAILVASRATAEQMPKRQRGKCYYLPENGIDPARFARRRTHTAKLPLRLIFIGRLVPYKGADMLLEAALPLLRAGALLLEIVGDGPQMSELRATVEQEGLAERVALAGWVEHARVQDRLVEADLMVLPSIREFGGGVVLEAMAVGVPPAVVAYGGPGELVSDNLGFRIELGTRAEIVARLRALLDRLVADPAAIDRRAEPAWRCAHERFAWSSKADQTLAFYEWVLGRRAVSPLPAWTEIPG